MGDGDAAGLRRLLEPHDETDGRAEPVVAADEDIGETDADAHPDRVAGAHLVELVHRGLEGDRPLDPVLDARELDQGAVAHRLEQVAGMAEHRGAENIAAQPRKLQQRLAFVTLDEPGISRDIQGREHGQFARGALHQACSWGERAQS